MCVSRPYILGVALILSLAGCTSWSHTPHVTRAGSAVTTNSSPNLTGAPSPPATPLQQVIAGSVEQTSYTFYYDPSYAKLDYPGGDVPLDRGVCADVVIRAFRKSGVDLQKEVHEDIKDHFAAYPQKWGARGPDANIDHRRVANLMTYLQRRGKALAVTTDPQQYRPGDVVAWDLGNGLLHIGVVSDIQAESKQNYQVVHNIGAGAKAEDVLFAWRIIGHYRYFHEETKKAADAKSRSKPGKPLRGTRRQLKRAHQ